MRRSSGIPPHPGRIMRTAYLSPRAISVNQLVQASGLKESYVKRVLAETASINNDTALKFAKAFGTTPQFWLLLQENRTEYENKRKQREREHADRVSEAVAQESVRESKG